MIGHKHIYEFLTQSEPYHAYLFVGPRHVGKTALAREFAAAVLQVPESSLHTSGDFSILQREKNPKTDKTRKDITIDQTRRFIEQFRLSSGSSTGYKIGLIVDAHLLSQAAANALLKTLEEPGNNRIIILTTIDESFLLPTIRSRCQQVVFQPVPESDIAESLKKEGISAQQAATYAEQSYGRPGLAFAWAKDPEAFQYHTQERQRFDNFLHQPFFAKLKDVEELFGDKTDHIATRDALIQTLNVWRLRTRELIRSGHQAADQLAVAESRMISAQQDLTKNIHPRLLVERILLALP